MRNEITYKVSGRYALFSDPINRMGGEKLTYLVPHYQGIKGITESIYWKPSLLWVVDEIRVINPIRTESKNLRPISFDSPKNTLSVYTYLRDVEYEVRTHFIANPYRTEPDLIEDGKNENKHHNIAKRQVIKGGRRDIFLGTRECQGYVEPCDFGVKPGYYDGSGEIDFGLMYHSFRYPDETGVEELGVQLCRIKMVDGIIKFTPPQDCDPELRRVLRPMKRKIFGSRRGNFTAVENDETLKDDLMGGELDGLDE